MGKGSTFSSDLLKLIFNATAISKIADNASATPLANLYLSLHTGDPGVNGNQQTNECGYTGYERVAVPRDGTGFTVTGASVSPAANTDFPEATAGSETATHFAIGTAASGAGKLLYAGSITPNIAISSGVVPRLKSNTSVTES
jgi:hypothetical protein